MLCSAPLRSLLFLVGKVFKWLLLRLVSVRSGRELGWALPWFSLPPLLMKVLIRGLGSLPSF